MAARLGRVTFLRVLAEEAPKGECEEWRTCCWGMGCWLGRWVVVIAVAQVRTGIVVRVFVDMAAALARARDMFALMFAEAVDGGWLDRFVYIWKRGSRLVTGLRS
jgi:hypothetical protein